MSLAFSFGSLGDILALTTLIKDLIEVLDDSRGSVSDYRVVVDRLRIQLKTVKRVDEVFGGPPKSTRDAEIQADVRQILRQIRACIDAFVVKLDKFGPNLTNGGSGNKLKDVLKKVNWRLDKKEIEAFETNLVAHTGLLDLHLGATAMDEIKSSRDQLSEQIAQNGDESKTALQAQSTSLRQLQAFLVALGRALLYKLNQVTQACQDIRHTVAQVFALGSAIQPKLDEILSKLEQVARPLEDLYFTLVDHLGIQRKIFLSNILSWDMFYDFLAIAYASELEPRSNTSRRFRLERILPDRIREHHIKPPWKTAFKPMQTVHLSIAHGPAYRSPDGRGRGPSCNSSIPRIFNQVFTKWYVERPCFLYNTRFYLILRV
ncbi:hypothetical protein B0T11DRAFT_280826 [Plectosphaerella cucumerina]|uniref:Fungal N-terminal domain-containing protein n=1 Tax=Plectosphaerella cucumerina TaxID=40658 RepID=A0A8K0TD76_9PEZI|nr:hypothetical protein B0T11DRAFT_280826 [Plectosphaerella cucumerina]